MGRMREGEMKGEMIFETKPNRGFIFRAWKLNETKGDALIEVERDGVVIRSFNFPAYKVWNIAAHSCDIIDSELRKDVDGYLMAGDTGLGGNIF
uniref:Uncharacterized protein n=1 Tax=viral metagenome TaxID=1070528 RepID=A0A6M3JFJ9_9ZZZZ